MDIFEEDIKKQFKKRSDLEKHVDGEFERQELSEAQRVKKELDEYQDVFRQLEDHADSSIDEKTKTMAELFANQRKATELCSQLLQVDEKGRDEETIDKLSQYISYIGRKIADSFSEVANDYRDSGAEVTEAVMDYGEIMQGHDNYLADIDNYGKGLKKL